MKETINNYRALISSTTSDTTNYELNIGTGEKSGIIHINQGFASKSYSLYEFHLFDNTVFVNKISGQDHISSFEYFRDGDLGLIKIVGSTRYLRFRAFFR